MLPSLKNNYLYRLFYEMLILITPFITAPYTARVLGAEGIGIYSYTHSIVAYFMLFAALGTSSYGAREIARNRNNKELSTKLFWEIELMTIMTTGVCMVGWIILIVISDQHRLFYLALTPFLLSTMFDISWFFSGLEMVKSIVVRNTIVRLVSIIALFTLVKTRDDLIIYFIIHSVTSFLGNLSMWVYLPGLLTKVDIRSLSFQHHFHETLIYFVPAAATSIYTLLDKTLIGLITGSSYQNGYYEQATKIVRLIQALVFVAINSVMGARISYLFAEEKFEEIKRRIHKSIDYVYFLAYGAVFGMIGITEVFIPIFLGDGYEPVIKLTRLMVPLVLIIGTSNTLGRQYFNPSGQRKRSAKIIVLGACINLILNLLLIPRFGVYGATIASIMAELFISLLYVMMCSGYVTWRFLWQCSWKRLIAGGSMLVLLILSGHILKTMPIFLLLIQLFLGLIAYCLLLHFLKDPILDELIGIVKNRVFKKQRYR